MKIDIEEIKYKLKSLSKSRVIIGASCLIFATIVGFIITPMTINLINKKVEVVEATRDIKVGEKITNNMYKTIKVGGYNVSNEIIKNKKDLDNKYAITPIIKGQYIYKKAISDIIPYDNEYLYTTLNGFNRALSFTIKNLANGVSNKLIQGDIISIIIVDTSQKNVELKAYIPDELKYIEVLSTTKNTGEDIQDLDEKEDERTYNTITVLVSDEQAKIIAEAEKTKDIYVELVYRQGNNNITRYFLNKQKEILNEKYPERVNEEEEKIIEKLFNDKQKIETKNNENNNLTSINNQLDNVLSALYNNNDNIEMTEEIIEEINNIENETEKKIDKIIKEQQESTKVVEETTVEKTIINETEKQVNEVLNNLNIKVNEETTINNEDIEKEKRLKEYEDRRLAKLKELEAYQKAQQEEYARIVTMKRGQ